MSLLDDAIAAHGGLDRWQRLSTLTLDVDIGGHLLALKGCSPRQRRLRVDVDPHRVHAVLTPFLDGDRRGVFEWNRLRIESPDGTVLDERAIGRGPDGSVRRRLVWGDLDLLYFFGYALWNYAVTPFVFRWPGFECREGTPWRERDGTVWRTLHVHYPADVPTHSIDQVFYFDSRSILRRLDYTADVFGPYARGVHLCDDARAFDEIVVPTRRVVHPRRRDGQPVRALRVMEGRIHGVTLS